MPQRATTGPRHDDLFRRRHNQQNAPARPAPLALADLEGVEHPSGSSSSARPCSSGSRCQGDLTPAGDAQRVWFPEMLEQLLSTWSQAMTWPELADFCARMTELRREIRQAKGILPPRTRCPHCGEVPRSDIKGVSFRSALHALKNGGVITDEEFEQLDKTWKKHRATHGLDAYGDVAQPRPATAHRCG